MLKMLHLLHLNVLNVLPIVMLAQMLLPVLLVLQDTMLMLIKQNVNNAQLTLPHAPALPMLHAKLLSINSLYQLILQEQPLIQSNIVLHAFPIVPLAPLMIKELQHAQNVELPQLNFTIYLLMENHAQKTLAQEVMVLNVIDVFMDKNYLVLN